MNRPKTLKRILDKRKIIPIVFRQWSNKRWAILASFHKVIIIGTLSFSYGLLAQGKLSVGPDSIHNQISPELEEVELTEALPAQLEDISLKPVALVTSREIDAAAATAPEDLAATRSAGRLTWSPNLLIKVT